MKACEQPGSTSTARVIRADFSPGYRDAPREEERVVGFLDLVGSTGIAERLGAIRYHALLSDVLGRLSLIVAEFGGEVHRYVGDALIATWPLGDAPANARAIECVFACQVALDGAACALLKQHGEVPGLRAGLHCGTVVVGEIGGSRRETALVGDAMNTAARIEETCRSIGHDVLASRELIACAALPPDVVAASIGSHTLRGKSRPVELVALTRCRMAASSGRALRECA